MSENEKLFAVYAVKGFFRVPFSTDGVQQATGIAAENVRLLVRRERHGPDAGHIVGLVSPGTVGTEENPACAMGPDQPDEGVIRKVWGVG